MKKAINKSGTPKYLAIERIPSEQWEFQSNELDTRSRSVSQAPGTGPAR
jgi:hypothetical protein